MTQPTLVREISRDRLPNDVLARIAAMERDPTVKVTVVEGLISTRIWIRVHAVGRSRDEILAECSAAEAEFLPTVGRAQ
jgi:hypothetical protein